MPDFNNQYEQVRIIKDDSQGGIALSAIRRHGESRKTKLKNNFTGLLESANSKLLLDLCRELNKKLPKPVNDEVVVGMYKSGIVMAGYLALARKADFTWSTPDQIGDYEQAISYKEDHREDKVHYFYGVHPGNKVVLVEDEVTSGKGLIGAFHEFQAHDVEVVAICSILETVNFNARELIKSSTGIDLISLVEIELY